VSKTTAKAKLVVLSGPSGVGKSTVLKRLLERYPDQLRLSVSATTRSPRPGEQDGIDYYFLSPEDFQRRRSDGEFVECFEVYGRGHWYGTLVSEVRPSPGDPRSVILDVDVAGANQVRRLYPGVPSIFLRPGSEEDLERRLRARGTESEEAIARRLEVARRELARAGEYQFQVVNDTVDGAVAEISKLLTGIGLISKEP
jgi:guanylate kinase